MMPRYAKLVLIISLPTIVLMLLTSIAFAAVSPDDASGTALELYRLLTKAEYMPATGAGLVLVVALLRLGLASKVHPWFDTRPGAYVVGYGSATFLMVGTTLAAAMPLTLGVVGQSIAYGWTSAGGFEAFRDFVRWVTGKLKAA